MWSCAVLNHSPTKFLDEIDAWAAEQTAKFEAEKLESEQTTGALRGPLPWREYEDESSSSATKSLDSSSEAAEAGAITEGESGGEDDKASFLESPASASKGVLDDLENKELRTSDEPVPTSSGRSALHALSAQVDKLAGKVNELAASLRPVPDALDGPSSASERSSGVAGVSENPSDASEASTSARPTFTQFFSIGAGNPFAEFGALHVANLAWAYAVLGETRRPAFARIWEEVERKRSVAFDDRMMSQLWQVHLTLKLEEQDLVCPLSLLFASFKSVYNGKSRLSCFLFSGRLFGEPRWRGTVLWPENGCYSMSLENWTRSHHALRRSPNFISDFKSALERLGLLRRRL